MPRVRSALLLPAALLFASCGHDTPEANATTLNTPASVVRESLMVSAFPPSYKRVEREKWTLTGQGVGALRFGMSLADAIVATKGDFFTPKANLDCSFFRSSRSPIGVKVMVADKKLVRIDVDSGATPTTEGIHIGSTEAQIKAAYPDAVVTPHKYTNGHVFTVDVPGGGKAVFETDGAKVKRYHIGLMPQVEWVEGCS